MIINHSYGALKSISLNTVNNEYLIFPLRYKQSYVEFILVTRQIFIFVYHQHHQYSDVIMRVIASRITGVSVVCSTVCPGADQRKHQSSASLAFVRGIDRWLNSTHNGPVTGKSFHLMTSSWFQWFRCYFNSAHIALVTYMPIVFWIVLCPAREFNSRARHHTDIVQFIDRIFHWGCD